MQVWRVWVFVLVLVTVVLGRGAQAGVRYEGLEHLSSSRASWFREVVDRLVGSCAEAPERLTVHVLDSSQVNAFAYLSESKGLEQANIAITVAMLDKVVEGDSNRLAFILGHELGHIVLGHPVPRREEQTPFVEYVYSRQQELEADLKGCAIALGADFSLRGTLKGIYLRLSELGAVYSSFEGMSASHPSWTERLAYVDREQSQLWRAMGSFSNGVVFLALEQYALAQRAFERVVKEFPSCYEAWSNLGYSLLMQYFDAMSPDDLKSFPVGYIVCGGFYSRPASLEAKVRGVDEELWWKAVGALREALRLQPKLSLAKANLGIAYLMRPSGADIGQAERLLQESLQELSSDSSVSALDRAAVLLNAVNVDLARGDVRSGIERLSQVERMMARAFEVASSRRLVSPLQAAFLYNRAMLLSRSSSPTERQEAFSLLERYLRHSSRSALWWSVGYERYRQLGSELGKTVLSANQLSRESLPAFRVTVSVPVRAGATVSLGEPLGEVEQRIGSGERTVAIGGTTLWRVRYREYGIELIGDKEVLAIRLTRSGSRVPIREQGIGGRSLVLQVGMRLEELETLLQDVRYDYRQFLDRSVHYRFYPSLGIAVRVEGELVSEIVVSQLPERPI